MKIRKRTWQIVEAGDKNDVASMMFDIVILILIAASTIAIICESIEDCRNGYGTVFSAFEFVTIIVFSIEYCLRVWSCVESERFQHPVWGRLRFILTPLQMVDFLAIAPFYLTAAGADLRAIRLLRMVRILRLFKLARYWRSLQLIQRAVIRAQGELMVTLSAILMLLIIASTVVYAFENETQPDIFSSIPAAMWWGIETITTVGYGEIVPITVGGKLVAGFVSVLGIGLVALPTAILGSAFVEELQDHKGHSTCPHCGERV